MLGNIGWPELLVLLVVVLLVFGTKKLRSLGGDLGSAIKEFKKAVATDDNQKETLPNKDETTQHSNHSNDSSKTS